MPECAESADVTPRLTARSSLCLGLVLGLLAWIAGWIATALESASSTPVLASASGSFGRVALLALLTAGFLPLGLSLKRLRRPLEPAFFGGVLGILLVGFIVGFVVDWPWNRYVTTLYAAGPYVLAWPESVYRKRAT